MSDEILEYSTKVDISEWVEKARIDPEAYLERQVTEIFLTSIGKIKFFNHKIFLKGGILMGVVYNSPRQTGDVDFTAIVPPSSEIANQIGNALREVFPRVTAELGYPDILCQMQSSRYLPNPTIFSTAVGPALKLKIGYARRGSPQEPNFQKGNATNVLAVDISFREPVGAIQIVDLGNSIGVVRAYSLIELMAEKFRALLQQEARNRFRRQDIYDLDTLIQRFSLDNDEKQRLHKSLLEKSAARNIEPTIESLDKPEIIRRAKKEWETLNLEIGELPDFDECFVRVNKFYRSLPWKA